MKSQRTAWLKQHRSDLALIGLLALLYAPVLLHWYEGWLHKSISIEHEYFSHGLIGLPFAAYIAWGNRKRWERLRDTPNDTDKLMAAGLMLVGAIFYLSGLPDPVNLSFPIVLTAICFWLKGWQGVKLQGFALCFVALATPNEIPYLIAPYTMPLQRFIAGAAGFVLNQGGMDVQVKDIYLFVNHRIVEVAPYCAGLKMLFTSLYVSLMLLYWRGNWRSRPFIITFFTATIVLSVTANILRNTFLTFFHGTGQEHAFTWLHDGWGGDLYSAGLLGLLVVLSNNIEKRLLPSDEQTLG